LILNAGTDQKIVRQGMSSDVARRAGEGEEGRLRDGRGRVVRERDLQVGRIRVTFAFPADALLKSMLQN
jgi:hypothetical protein